MKSGDEKIDAWRLMLQTHQRLTAEMDVELQKRHGLRLDWYDVLYQLSAAGGRMRMHELAEATLFSRTNCTRIVDRMERAGLVQREQADEDRRGVFAVVTDEGNALFRRAAATHLDDIRRLFTSQVTPAEATAMARALQRVLAEAEA